MQRPPLRMPSLHAFPNRISATMPDRNGLRLVGLAYGCVVAIVAMITLVVVTGHISATVDARPDPVIVGTIGMSAR